MHKRNTQRIQHARWANARRLQNLWRTNCTGGHHDLTLRTRNMGLPLPDKFNTCDALSFEAQACRARARQHHQVTTMLDRPQKSLGRIPTKTRALIDLEVTTAFVIAAIEIGRRRNTGLRRRVAKRIEDFPGQARGLHPPLAPRTMKRTRASVVIFHAFKQRQDLIPAPALIP